jgi:hypothetical protein
VTGGSKGRWRRASRGRWRRASFVGGTLQSAMTAQLAGERAHATARVEVAAAGAEPLSLSLNKSWWRRRFGGFDARVTWSLWADWATEHEMVPMGHMCSVFYSFSFHFLFPEIHFIT